MDIGHLWNTALVLPLEEALIFFAQVTGSAGLAIILFTIVVKVVLFPLTWQQISTPSHQYQMFVQLLTQDETARVAGYDGPPENSRSSTATNTWVDAGEIRLGERFDMAIPADAAPGTYKLVVGLYDVEAPDQRVPVLDASGAQVGTYAVIQELTLDACTP